MYSLQQTLYNKYQYRPSYFKVWEAKQKVINRAFGDWDKSYKLLPKWLKALTNVLISNDQSKLESFKTFNHFGNKSIKAKKSLWLDHF